jgi:peroxiredoxin (alkyl hydroperoxide reductase subunit C)
MIKKGDKVPAMKLMAATPEGPREVDTAELFGAGKAKGVDRVICMAVNDAFVMGAWAKDQKTGEGIVMLADGSGAFTKALGLELDLVARGLGVRSQRFALVAQDGVVTHLAVEEPGGFDVSRAEAVLEAL